MSPIPGSGTTTRVDRLTAVERTGLDINDWWSVARLKYLRNRSLANPSYRDSRFVRLFIAKEKGHSWSDPDSPLENLRASVEKRLDDYDRLMKRKEVRGAESAWQMMLEAVDAVISEGERIEGKRIRPRS